jgi:poly(ADP-ribose) glycohydrolase
MPKGVVSFERISLTGEEVPVWRDSNKALKKLVVLKNGFIETEGEGLLQVDFANRFLGGGVLNKGCVQEEIRFAICPELLISRLFTEQLLNNEAVIISGCEQFNSYTGYANDFEWTGDYKDTTPHDEWGRRLTRIVAIDAIKFESRQRHTQYEMEKFERELNKAFSGFIDRRDCDPRHKYGIASGNWGCGAYNGDPHLKAIIQLMAASQADRDLVYFTFDDQLLKQRLTKFYKFIINNDFKVRHLHRALQLYEQNIQLSNTRRGPKVTSNLLDFIKASKNLIFHS